MSSTRVRALAPYLAAWAVTVALPLQASTLDVRVLGVQRAEGEILVALCAPSEAVGIGCRHVGRATPQAGEVVVTLDDAPEGVFALWVMHDLDGDRQLKRGALGLPQEPFGFGNDASLRFGPPSFEQAAIRVGGGRTEVTVRLRHR